jgi:hypothetical protein
LGSKSNKTLFWGQKSDMTIEILLEIFPKELMDYFKITGIELFGNVQLKRDYWIIDFEEKNEVPLQYVAVDYESKGFLDAKLVQDFPIRGKGVFLRIRKRRWRHKLTGAIIQSNLSFLAAGSKFTQELSDFLKDGSSYATRYHNQYSQLLPD